MRRVLNSNKHEDLDRQQAKKLKSQPEYSKICKEFLLDKGPISCLDVDPSFEMLAVGGK